MFIHRNIAMLLIAAVLAVPSVPVHAQGNGNGNGNGQGQGNSQGNGNGQGQGNSQGQGNGHGQGNGNGPGQGQGQGQGNGQGQGQGNGNNGAAPGAGNSVTASDAEFALEAVRSRRALPLADILAAARSDIAGELIDAELVTIRGFLVYEVKSMTSDGRVSRSYYYAKSGRKVGTD